MRSQIQEEQFFRGWTSDYFLTHPREGSIPQAEGITSVPGSAGLRVTTLGGTGLAISESSSHRAEAIQLVRFLLQKEARSSGGLVNDRAAGSRELFELPLLLKAFPDVRKGSQGRGANVVLRPSSLTLDKYDATTKAYVLAVHSVSSGETKATVAAASLERDLTRITDIKPSLSSRVSRFGIGNMATVVHSTANRQSTA
jgi:trehalose/maltose transport system substrate-binding protein